MAKSRGTGTLKQSLTFKRLGGSTLRHLAAGDKVRYERSPVEPGVFIVWSSKWFYAKVNAIDFPVTVQEA